MTPAFPGIAFGVSSMNDCMVSRRPSSKGQHRPPSPRGRGQQRIKPTGCTPPGDGEMTGRRSIPTWKPATALPVHQLARMAERWKEACSPKGF